MGAIRLRARLWTCTGGSPLCRSIAAWAVAGKPLAAGVRGGAGETRTPDFRLAKAALSQLSYGPGSGGWKRDARRARVVSLPVSRLSLPMWWAMVDSNHRPRSYQDRALTS